MAVDGAGRLLVNGVGNSLEILDLSVPGQPVAIPAGLNSTSTIYAARYFDDCFFLGSGFVDSYAIQPNPNFRAYFEYPGFPPGEPRRMKCAGDYLYLTAGEAGLLIYDITVPAQPVLAGHVPAGEFVRFVDVELYQGLAYVSADTGVEIIDISDPRFPQTVGRVQNDFGVRTVKIHNDLAYVSFDFLGVGIYDLSDPLNPEQLGFFPFDLDAITGMEFLSTYGYFCAGWAGMIIMDLSDPTNPSAIFTEDFEEGVWDVQLEGNVLYVSTDTAVKVVSVNNPQIPIIIAPAEIYGYQRQLHVIGTTAYTADETYGMVIVDAANPAIPTIASSTPIDGSGASAIRICDNFAYVSGASQLHVFDVSNTSQPQELTTITTTASHEIVVQDGDLMVSGGDNFYLEDRLTVFERQDGTWQPVSSIESRSNVDMELRGSILFVTNGNEATIYDLTDPTTPVELSRFQVGGVGLIQSIYVSGNHLYFTGNSGLRIMGIEDLANPVPVGLWFSSAVASDVVVIGDYAFVALSFDGIQVLDVSNPQTPAPVTSLQPSVGAVNGLALDGSRLLAFGQFSSLIYDVTDPTQPQQLGVSFSVFNGQIEDGVLEGNAVYFATRSGVESINISDPDAPVQMGLYQTPNPIRTISRSGVD